MMAGATENLLLQSSDLTLASKLSFIKDEPLFESYKSFLSKFSKLHRLQDFRTLRRRFDRFKKTTLEIEQHNQPANSPPPRYYLEINEFADELDEDLHLRFGLLDSSQETEISDRSSNISLDSFNQADSNFTINTSSSTFPSTLNWASVENPLRMPVVSAPSYGGQGSCGACWAFVATHAAQATVTIALAHFYNTLPQARTERMMPSKLLCPTLSAQELLDCDDSGFDRGCSGGDPYWALFYILNKGVHARDTYPAYSQQVLIPLLIIMIESVLWMYAYLWVDSCRKRNAWLRTPTNASGAAIAMNFVPCATILPGFRICYRRSLVKQPEIFRRSHLFVAK